MNKKISSYLLFIILILVSSLFLVSCGGENRSSENTDDISSTEVSDGSFTKDEAQASGGIYVLTTDDKYFPAQEGVRLMSSANHFFFTDASSDIPVLHDGESLVLFTAATIDESQSRTIFPVTKTGYTIPLYKEMTNDNWEVSELFYAESPVGYDPQIESVDGVQQLEESIHYLDSGSFCSDEDGRCGEPYSDTIFCFDGIKDVVVGYYDGSSYEEATFSSDIQYFVYDSCVKGGSLSAPSSSFAGIQSQISLTDQGYALINTDALEPGIYIVKELDDKEYYHNGKDNSQTGFVFRKE